MKILHQAGFRTNWNIESYVNGVGDGIIFSPVNIDAEILLSKDVKIKQSGFLDPQLYLLKSTKGSLETYPYHPTNIKVDFSTNDLDYTSILIAENCINYQLQNQFEYLVIPTRYYNDASNNYYFQISEYFVKPFLEIVHSREIQKKVLLSFIVKQTMLTNTADKDELLNWITSYSGISGVYLIFENSNQSKQIKDYEHLLGVLKFIQILKRNQLEVHIGYTNTEGLLYSIAMPDSITIGSYENLRSFGIKRFQEQEASPMKGPNARLYSSKLLQWIDYKYILPMRKLISNCDDFFDESEYAVEMFQTSYRWHFAKADLYKHYFKIYYCQIKNLPMNQNQRIESVRLQILNAIDNFNTITQKVLLDENSDGSHLRTWMNVLNVFESELRE